VLDELSPCQPSTGACSHHCRVAAACRRASYPSATRCCMPYSSLNERQSCPVPSLSRSRSGRTRAEPPWPPPPSSRATTAPSLTALLRLHRASLRIRRITTPLLRPFFGHRGRRSTVAASSGGLKPPASVAAPPQAASGQAGQPSVCARTPWCFPITPPPPTSFLRPPPAVSPKSSSVQSRPGTSRKNSTNSRGLTAQSVTQMNSAARTDS
jgi:hypothetical protein